MYRYGFRKKHSTELPVLEVIYIITYQLGLDQGILLNKLQYYGVNGSALALFRNYLTELQQYVNYNERSSSLEHISNGIPQGIPQGSILGPLLCSIYINDIAQSSAYFKCITYADDTTLNGIIAEQIDIDNIEMELKNITEWLKMNKLSLNVKKPKAMLFHMPQKKIIVGLPTITNKWNTY